MKVRVIKVEEAAVVCKVDVWLSVLSATPAGGDST